MAGASEGVSLPPCAQVSLLVVLVGPHLVPPVLHVLTRCPDSSGLPHLLALKLIRSLIGDSASKEGITTKERDNNSRKFLGTVIQHSSPQFSDVDQ